MLRQFARELDHCGYCWFLAHYILSPPNLHGLYLQCTFRKPALDSKTQEYVKLLGVFTFVILEVFCIVW